VSQVATGNSSITSLASFSDNYGANPFGSVIEDSQGNLFGTSGGGAYGPRQRVYELAAGSSSITTLASFNGPATGPAPTMA